MPGSDDPGDCNCPNSSSSRQNSRYATECVCYSGFYKEYNGFYPLGGWYCRLCQVGEFCFNNTNRTCPAFSTSFGVARSFSDCFCNPGYQNTTIRTEEVFCENCPANYYCTGKGSVDACTANAISPTQSQDQTRCYCDLGWKGLNNTPCVACQSPTICYGGVQAQCSEGTFSPALAWDRLNCSCIPGRWGPPGGPCIMCGAGKYNLYPGCKACSNTSDVDCELCALGTASTSLGRDTTCDVCGAGTYSFPVNSRGAQTCEPCGTGFAAPVGSSNCTLCQAGQYAAAGFSACVACPAGTFGVGLVSACTACDSGKFSLLGSTACTNCSICSIGQYNVSNCNSSANIVCGACANPVVSTQASRVIFTGAGTAGPQSCSWCCIPGTWFSSSGAYGGYFCVGLGVVPEWAYCGVRYSCPANSRSYTNSAGTQTACTCNAGFTGEGGWNTTWQNFPVGTQLEPPANWNGVNCEACPTGMYSTGSGETSSSRCISCIAGTFSTGLAASSAINCTTCQTGTYSTGLGMTTSSICTNCATCTTGQYNVSNCISSANIVCGACAIPIREDHASRFTFTDKGGNGPNSCPWTCKPGYAYSVPGCWTCFANVWCLYNISRPCPANSGHNQGAIGTQSTCKCNTGFYGLGGWSSTVPLLPGQIAPPDNWNGVNCETCPAGTYNTGTGVSMSSRCISCIAGTYSTTLASPNSVSCLSCQPGTYQTGTGMQNPLDCTLCQPGTYQTGTGMANPLACLLCQPGAYQTGLGMSISSNCQLCQSGTYSSFSGSSSSNSCLSCQPGKYSTSQGAYSSTTCEACQAGTFASSAGTPRCPPCPEGSFTPFNASTNCSLCELGVFSYAGMTTCQSCQAGKYKEYEGCFFCSNSTDADCQACYPGSASNTLARQDRCDWCEPGYYASSSGLQACSPCGNGSIALGAAQACFSCPLGYFAPIGSSACTPCPPDTYLDIAYQGSTASCKQCPTGKVSPYTGAQTVLACTACFPGKYKLLEECQLCETGKYSNIAGMTTCSACPNGTISESGASACWTCLLGTYAPAGTAYCLDCPSHTYLDYQYAGSVQNCKPCPPGTWSWMSAIPSLQMCYPCQPGTYELNRYCLDCHPGYFSGKQATACLTCPTGKYSGAMADNCTLCPAGSYSDRSNASSCLICPPGTFSQAGSSGCQPCPIAEFSSNQNTSACQSCPAGSFSDQTGGTNCTECGPGAFSIAKSSACLLCSYGTFNNQTNQSQCQPCRNGTFAPPGFLEVCKKIKPSKNQIMLWSRFLNTRYLYTILSYSYPLSSPASPLVPYRNVA